MSLAWRRPTQALAGLSLVLLLSCGLAAAQSGAGSAFASLDRIAAQSRQEAAAVGDARLGRAVEQANRERLIAVLSALAIASIAEQPGRREEIAAAAAAAAPEVAAEVRARIAAAYPAGAQPARPAMMPVIILPTLPQGAADLATERQRRAAAEDEARLEATMIGAIGQDPAALESHVAAAVGAMPAARERLVAAASRAYPGYAARIAQAASGFGPGAVETASASVPERLAPEPVVVSPETVWDPLEPMNRLVFSVNEALDFVVFRPVAWVYNRVAPDPVILAMRRFFENLREPVVIANDVLQLSFKDAAEAVGRFGVNTTIGLLGFLDPATGMGLEHHRADFGQTLHSYGLGPGPYVVLPLLGPSTMRDGFGEVVDTLMAPQGYLLPQTASLALTGTKALVKREDLLTPVDELKAASVDYYVALRSAHYQRRAIELSKDRGSLEAPQIETDKLFDEAR